MHSFLIPYPSGAMPHALSVYRSHNHPHNFSPNSLASLYGFTIIVVVQSLSRVWLCGPVGLPVLHHHYHSLRVAELYFVYSCLLLNTIEMHHRDFRDGPVVKNLPSSAGDVRSIPDQETKPLEATRESPRATTRMQHSQKWEVNVVTHGNGVPLWLEPHSTLFLEVIYACG